VDNQKGFDLLLDIWRDFSRSHPDWTLVIAGDGELSVMPSTAA
jgi:glycosyltransferase involved in cell wall biosynthesis